MASFTSSVTCPILLKSSVTAISTEPVYGLPRMIKRSSGVKCSMETKQPKQDKSSTAGSSALAVMLTAVMSSSSPAMALVDERMSTEGTGLPFGLSNNLLGWILFGVFGLIWALYFTYTSSLDEDDDSGLSL